MKRIGKDKKRELFTLLLKSRRFEEKLVEVMTTGKDAYGWVHAGLGEEAIGVGVTAHLNRDDYINYNHRVGRAIIITKGIPVKRFLLDALGKQGGPCKGMGGEVHYCDVDYGIIGYVGTLGAQSPINAGIALACKYRNSSQVVVNILGDGTVDEGNVHETMNMASLWKLPMVFVVQNNRWAQFASQSGTAGQPDIWRKAEAYNMPGEVADGTDLLAVYETSREAIERARKGEGPTLVEYRVNRWYGHYSGDDQSYRKPEDIEEARKRDPVAIFQQQLLDEGILTRASIDELEGAIRTEIDEALTFALESPPPPVEQAFENVYCVP